MIAQMIRTHHRGAVICELETLKPADDTLLKVRQMRRFCNKVVMATEPALGSKFNTIQVSGMGTTLMTATSNLPSL